MLFLQCMALVQLLRPNLGRRSDTSSHIEPIRLRTPRGQAILIQ